MAGDFVAARVDRPAGNDCFAVGSFAADSPRERLSIRHILRRRRSGRGDSSAAGDAGRSVVSIVGSTSLRPGRGSSIATRRPRSCNAAIL
jgi:hypothetical protein